MNDPHPYSPDTPSHSNGLDPCEFSSAIGKADELAKRLRSDYPLSKPYLVVSIQGVYVKDETIIHETLKAAPSIFVDNASKTAVLKHLHSTPPHELNKKENESRLKQYKETLDKKLANLMGD